MVQYFVKQRILWINKEWQTNNQYFIIQKLFNDQYYGKGDEAEEKPQFSDSDEDGDVPDYDDFPIGPNAGAAAEPIVTLNDWLTCVIRLIIRRTTMHRQNPVNQSQNRPLPAPRRKGNGNETRNLPKRSVAKSRASIQVWLSYLVFCH